MQIITDTVSKAGYVTVAAPPSSAIDHPALHVSYSDHNMYLVSYASDATSRENYIYTDRTTDSQSHLDTFSKAAEQPNTSVDSSLAIFRGADSSLKLTYVTYGIWERHQNSGANHTGQRIWFLIGQPTEAASWPKTGMATYTGITDGEVVCLEKIGPILKRALRGMGIGELYGTSAFYAGADHSQAA